MAACLGEDVPARLQRLKKPYALGYFHRMKVEGNTALLEAASGLHAAFPDDKDFLKAMKGVGFVLADPARGSRNEAEAKKRMTQEAPDAGNRECVAPKQKRYKPELKTFSCGLAGSHVVAKPYDSDDWRIVDMPEVLRPTALAAIHWDVTDLPRPTGSVEKVTTFQIRLCQDGEWRFRPNEYGGNKIVGLRRLHNFLKGNDAGEQARGEGVRQVGKPKNADVRGFDCGLAGRRFVIKPASPKPTGDWRIVDRPAALLPQLGDRDWAACELPRHEGPVEKVTRFHVKRVVDKTWRFRPREYNGVRVGRIQRLYRLLRGDVVKSTPELDAPKPSRQVIKDVVSFDCGIANGEIVMKPSESDSWSVVKKPAALQLAELATQPWATFDIPPHIGAVDKATSFQIVLHCNGEWRFRPCKVDNARAGGLQRLCRLLKGDVPAQQMGADALGKKLKAVSIAEKPAKNKFPPRVVQKLQAIPAGSQIQIHRGKTVSKVAVVGADGKVTDADKSWDSAMDWALPFKTDNFRCGKHILVNGTQLRNTDHFNVPKDHEYVMVSSEAGVSD